LHPKDLCPTLNTMTAAERTRQRLREELIARDISQRDLADALSKRGGTELCTQSKISKVLSGRVALRVDDADAIATAAGISLTEAVRDRGIEFCAEMTPSELRVLELLRQRPEFLQGVMLLLRIPPPLTKPSVGDTKRRKRGRPKQSESAKKPRNPNGLALAIEARHAEPGDGAGRRYRQEHDGPR
jgi:transcriptional regulator with XRE-family HTH domain